MRLSIIMCVCVCVCVKKRGLDVRPAKRMVHDRNVWRGFVKENSWGAARGMNP